MIPLAAEPLAVWKEEKKNLLTSGIFCEFHCNYNFASFLEKRSFSFSEALFNLMSVERIFEC